MKKTFSFLLLILTSSITISQEKNSNTEITKIIVVRHAEKIDDGSKNPSLSDIGKLRAKKLDMLFADLKLDALYSTPFSRTTETLQPIANSRNLEIINYSPNNKNFSQNLLLNQKGKTIMIVGHSNTCPDLVNSLINETKFNPLNENEYGKIWIITFKNGQLIDCVLLNY
ncbi:MAG TPA: histidine phosphatase family protein [Flavobacterium sp.]|jgi:broad specificity phosphatase PhoE|uniref:SixA phosphatase family protein n=1 Tax=Flavobacterium sp. TaxID=239 RepID=UPI002BB6C5E1|nr:histidine phosphatase family protein [Flavobacterium sp.]MCA0349983.1 histidine phosphatase family protein [Bacteroidota bacterium]HPW97111.1 histidine phosphatase family protein [Flavobacterium sp.]HQA73544.1 histidine phosphatase family protein [Flavobacterium sp.]